MYVAPLVGGFKGEPVTAKEFWDAQASRLYREENPGPGRALHLLAGRRGPEMQERREYAAQEVAYHLHHAGARFIDWTEGVAVADTHGRSRKELGDLLRETGRRVLGHPIPFEEPQWSERSYELGAEPERRYATAWTPGLNREVARLAREAGNPGHRDVLAAKGMRIRQALREEGIALVPTRREHIAVPEHHYGTPFEIQREPDPFFSRIDLREALARVNEQTGIVTTWFPRSEAPTKYRLLGLVAQSLTL